MGLPWALFKSGSITLVERLGGISLDPRDNNDFRPGKPIAVTWNGAPHPLAGNLLVLEYPTVDTISPDLPFQQGNLIVTIPVACRLKYFSTIEPDDNQSGVEIGAASTGQTVCQKLLEAGGIEPGDIALGSFDNEFDFPIQKQGGGFIDQAGQVCYSARSNRGPSYLYCDQNNAVKAATVNLDSSASITVTLGVNDREYRPLFDGSDPPRVVQAVGIRRRVKTRNQCESIQRITPGQRVTTEFCQYDPWEIEGYWSPFPNFFLGLKAAKAMVQTIRIEERKGRWREKKREETYSLFDENGRLFSKKVRIFQRKGDVNLAIATQQLSINERFVSSVTTEKYTRDSQGRITKIERDEWQAKTIVNPAESINPWTKTRSLSREQAWRKNGQFITESLVIKRPKITISPEATTDIYDLIVDPDDSTYTSSTTGQSQPPRLQEWEPLPYVEQDQLSEEVEFEDSRKRSVVQVPYAFSVSQLRAIARIEGEIDRGRQVQYLVEFDPDLAAGETAPLPIVRITGGDSRIVMADALTWEHTETEDFVGCAGIGLGNTTVSATSRVGGFPGRLIYTPKGAITISGLKTDGVIAEAQYGYTRTGRTLDALF